MSVSEDRQYVIVCREHKALLSPALLFWGSLTDDDAKRSYSDMTNKIMFAVLNARVNLCQWIGTTIGNAIIARSADRL